MAENPAADPDYNLTNVENIDPNFAEILLEDAEGEELVSCKPIPGAEKMPPNKLNIAPQRTVRIYELGDQRGEEFILVTCLLHGGQRPGGILIDRAVVFDGSVLEMLDSMLKSFDEADWSRGIKSIENIRTTAEYDHVAEFLDEVRTMLEDASEDRYAMDLWEEYMQNGQESSL